MELKCRVCLEVEELMISLYEEVEDLQSCNLSSLLEMCGGLKVDQNDCYPKYLCKECASELLISAKFREKCARAQQLLEQFKIEDEAETGALQMEVCDGQNEQETLPNNNNEEQSVSQEVFVEFTNALVDEDQHDPTISIIEELHSTEELVELDSTDANGLIIFGYEDASVDHDEFIMEQQQPEISNVGKLTIKHTLSDSHVNFICDICGAVFIQSKTLQRHMHNVHMPLQTFNCSKCQYCFSEHAQYVQHSNNCKAKCQKQICSNIIDLSCIHCGKQTQSQFALNMHLRTHTNERPFQCEHCLKTFKTTSALTLHLKRHAGTPDYECKVCGKTFYETSNLTVHMRTHSGEKPHTCRVCGKSFARVFLLQLHMRTHTGEKPYKCSQCERAFAQLCDLKNHMLTHTASRRFQCPACSRTFVKRQPWLQHMERHSELDLPLDMKLLRSRDNCVIEEIKESDHDDSCNSNNLESDAKFSFNDFIEEDVV